MRCSMAACPWVPSARWSARSALDEQRCLWLFWPVVQRVGRSAPGWMHAMRSIQNRLRQAVCICPCCCGFAARTAARLRPRQKSGAQRKTGRISIKRCGPLTCCCKWGELRRWCWIWAASIQHRACGFLWLPGFAFVRLRTERAAHYWYWDRLRMRNPVRPWCWTALRSARKRMEKQCSAAVVLS